MIELNRIYNEDCLEGMKGIPDKSIKLIVTDPTYYAIAEERIKKAKQNKLLKILEV